MDRISDLPDNVIKNILCLLPLLDAVKTCLLARAWKNKWKSLPKLILDCEFWESIPEDKGVEVYIAILVQHIGKLHELYLYTPWDSVEKTEWLSPKGIQYALKKGITRLTLEHYPHSLPSCIYSSTQLTHLELEEYADAFSPPALFSGLPNLISFTLNQNVVSVKEDADKIMNFISKCSNIQRLSLYVYLDKDLRIHAPKLEYLSVSGSIYGICFLEAKNLRYLDLCFFERLHNDVPHAEKCPMNLKSLVKLEHLSLNCESFEVFVSSGVSRSLSQRFDQLKILQLGHIDLRETKKLAGLLFLFASSPNLYKLLVNDENEYGYEYSRYDGEEIDFESQIDLHRDHKFETLHAVKYYTKGFEVDVKMIGFLLGCSPKLEMMSIGCDFKNVDDFVKKVLKLTCASPKARVEFFNTSTFFGPFD